MSIEDALWGTLRGVIKTMVRNLKHPEMVRCKYCGSDDVVKYGQSGGIQRWWCKDCKRKFVDNNALPTMRTPIRQIGAILSMWYGGMSLQEIKRHSEQQYKSFPSRSTLYRWLVRFSKIAINEAKKHPPKVGNTWVADETVIKIGGSNIWFWDIIDIKTRFLLASHMSLTRTIPDARTLVEKASERAGKTPETIITDKLWAYIDGIEIAFGADTRHIAVKGITSVPNTNLIERFHGSLKSRTKVLRGFKSYKTAKLLLDGWLVHYNFFRDHETLGDRTPAEEAGIEFPFKDWLDVAKSQTPETQQGIDTDRDIPARPNLTLHHPKGTRKAKKRRSGASRNIDIKIKGVR